MTAKKVSVSLWLLIAGIILFCLAIIGVGLGVYYGTKPATASDDDQSTTTAKASTTQPPAVNIRLPTDLSPISYNLSIQTFLPSPTNAVTYDSKKNFTFDGNVTITFECATPTNVVVMQLHQIDIHHVILYNSTWDEIQLETYTDTYNSSFTHQYRWDNVTQKVTFTLSSGHLRQGDIYYMVINYTGILNDVLAGFYRSSYEEYGEMKWLAVTQFEPTDARRAFPCFDEPSFKAVFNLVLIHPSDMIAISNAMEQPATDYGNGWSRTAFGETPKMSTYLFAMCVADFESRSSLSYYNVTFRVWARKSFINDAWYALEAGPRTLTFYADYFQIPFPLEKEDMVALPDFGAGAMENWGMITYRERDLLYNNATYSAYNLQEDTIDITHELAHQWFGDLVTLAWWDDLWLNEGFAEFMQYKGADNISNGDYEMSYQFVPLEIDLFMGLDQLTSSHPIYDPALQTPDEINSAFDDISYDKGASVIHQLENTLSEKVFQTGLQYYLGNYSYGNADHQDLWNNLQLAVNTYNTPMGWDGSLLNVTEFMNPWILQMNFPLITAVKLDNTTVQLTQSRFLLPGNFSVNPQYETSVYNFTWYIPVWYNQVEGIVSNMYWVIPYKTTNVTVKENAWFLINSGVYGLYRVNYEQDNWNLLMNQLYTDLTKIDTRNRAQLLDDALNIAKTGALSYNIALSLTMYLTQEYSFIPWSSVTPAFAYFQNMFALTQDYEIFGAYIKKIIQPIYNTVNWTDNEPYTNITIHQLNQFIVSTMCELADPSCLKIAENKFQTQLKMLCDSSFNGTSNCSKVDPNFRKAVYCAGIGEGNIDTFSYLYQRYPEEQVAVERDNILYGLCCSKQPSLLLRLLNQAIDPNSTFIRSQDSQYVFQYIGENDVGRVMIWPYFVENFPAISKMFASGSFSLADIVQSVTQSFNTQRQVDEMKLFLKENYNSLGSGLSAFSQQISVAEANVVWMETYADEVIAWFKTFVSV